MLLSEHCHIQPSEWDNMPYSQYQFMLDFKINNTKNQQAQQQQESPEMASFAKQQRNMMSSMSKTTSSFKMHKFKM